MRANEIITSTEQLDENLRKWFKEKWVRFGPDGKIRGSCARGDDSEGKPKCLPQAKAHALGKKGRKYAASKKRREDPNPERRGPAKNVATKKKSNEGVAEGFPQPGESSGKAKQFNPNAKIQTREMTLDQILSSVKGIPYVNEVIQDWDAKDYSWGVTKKVIEYAQYLQKNPQSVANLPPLVVIDGQLNDGAHRLSAINLLQKRMDPKNPLWKKVKLKVNFGTSDDVASEQGVAEEQLDELKCWPGYTRVKGVPAGAPGSCKKKTNEEELEEKWSQKYKDSINCSNPKGFSQKAHCAGKKKDESMYENKCPHCGGEMVSEELMNEKKDACYYKVKSRYKVWPSAYASGALVKCRKKGAKNWGNKSESVEEGDKLQGTPVVSLKDFGDKDTKKDKYGRTVPKKLKKDDPRVKFHKDQKLDELSPETLASYKKKAGQQARELDKAAFGGDKDAKAKIAKANKRFGGIMKATKKEFKESHILQGIMLTEQRTYKLWESAGRKLVEAQLTADQIKQLFANIEQGAAAGGANRTLVGKGLDAASAVNKAWEDLKTKVQDSGPIKNVDAMYDQAAEKLKQATGGDQGVMKYVQMYRDFAKKHPVAQGLIYSALIAAAGISGAGLGGAAALGLFKMVDKLLQGEKFSSAAYSGAKTGAMAYGASKIGDLIKGKPEGGVAGGGEVPADIQKGLEFDQAMQDRILNKYPSTEGYTLGANGDTLEVFDSAGRKVFTSDIPLKTMNAKQFADLTNNGKLLNPTDYGSVVSQAQGAGNQYDAGGSFISTASNPGVKRLADWAASNFDMNTYNYVPKGSYVYIYDKAGQLVGSLATNPALKKAGIVTGQQMLELMKKAGGAYESVELTEATIRLVFSRTALEYNKQLTEGFMDSLKGAAGKAADWVGTKAKNITTKITADKLMSAWKKAGSPTDSGILATLLVKNGVPHDIMLDTFAKMKIPTTSTPAATSKTTTAQPTQPAAKQVTKPTVAPTQQGVNPELQKRLAARKAGNPKFAGGLEEVRRTESAIMKGLMGETLGTPDPGTYEQETAPIRRKGQTKPQAIAFENRNE